MWQTHSKRGDRAQKNTTSLLIPPPRVQLDLVTPTIIPDPALPNRLETSPSLKPHATFPTDLLSPVGKIRESLGLLSPDGVAVWSAGRDFTGEFSSLIQLSARDLLAGSIPRDRLLVGSFLSPLFFGGWVLRWNTCEEEGRFLVVRSNDLFLGESRSLWWCVVWNVDLEGLCRVFCLSLVFVLRAKMWSSTV